MKIFTLILSILAFGLIIYNFTKLDFSNLFEGESTVALITIFASLCAILLLQILRISKKIEEKNIIKESLIKSEYFSVDKFIVNGKYNDQLYKNFRIYSILEGIGKLICEEKEYKIIKGDTYFIPANKSVEIIGSVEIIKSYI